MKTHQFYSEILETHGVDITTDSGERFGVACPDEATARQIAMLPEAIELLSNIQADVMKMVALRDPDQLGTWGAIFNDARKFFTKLDAQP